MIALSISNDITKGYKSIVVPFNRVGDYTTKYNYSASSYKDGYRSGENVLSLGNVLIYDFDSGAAPFSEMELFLRDNAVGSILATSKSHGIQKGDKPACDRFRLFVPLSKTLKINFEDYSDFYVFAAKVLAIDEYIDPACKDRSRFYYPNPRQEVRYINTGYILDTRVLEDNFKIYLEKTSQNLQQKSRYLINQTNQTKNQKATRSRAKRKSKSRAVSSNTFMNLITCGVTRRYRAGV